jgi:hypothetical protein
MALTHAARHQAYLAGDAGAMSCFVALIFQGLACLGCVWVIILFMSPGQIDQ